jgi:lipopolysaccharide transport system permease protein
MTVRALDRPRHAETANTSVAVIEPAATWVPLRLREIWEHRDLLYFLVRRDIKVRYAQSILGIGWAVIQPLFTMLTFTIVFGNLAKVPSGGVPYAIFSYAALVPWTYFSTSLTHASGSVLNNVGMITKVYFPRLILPLAPLLSKLVDLGIAMVLLVGMMIYYRITPTIWALSLPVLVLLTMLTALGAGMWLAAMSVQYRDVSHLLGFGVQLLMYASPVVYPASLVPERLRLLYGINPMAGIIEGFRSALLGTTPMPWDLLAVGTVTALAIAVSGSFYFRRTERIFADVA